MRFQRVDYDISRSITTHPAILPVPQKGTEPFLDLVVRCVASHPRSLNEKREKEKPRGKVFRGPGTRYSVEICRGLLKVQLPS